MEKAPEKLKPTVLIVDDDSDMRDILVQIVQHEFTPITAKSAEQAFDIVQKTLPDIILMDVMMPGEDGLSVSERIRNLDNTKHIPILILTASDDRANRVKGFSVGADDFITKPFNAEELTVRIHSKLKRAKEIKEAVSPTLKIKNLKLELQNQRATVDDVELGLSPVEFELLKILSSPPDHLVARKVILDAVWKKENPPDRVMDAHFVSLRKKLKHFQGEIRTVYGSGYLLHTRTE